MSKSSKTFILWVVIILVAYAGYKWVTHTQVENVPFTHLHSAVVDGNAIDVTYHMDTKVVTYSIEGKHYTTAALSESQMDVLSESSVTLERDSTDTSVFQILMWICISILTIKVIGLISRQTNDKKYRIVKPSENKTRLSDVISNAGQHDEVTDIIKYIRHGDEFSKVGLDIPKGILMEGPPGVGKTLMAKAIAGETNVTFIEVSGSEFVEMYVGMGAKRVREIFKDARKNAPSIIFIDEIDAIGGKRGNTGSASKEYEQTLNQLLVEMQGFSENEGVFVLGATNRVDTLDSALLRTGRFDRVVTISLPDMESRTRIAELYMKKYSVFFDGSEVLAEDIAKLTSGLSPSDINTLINEAAILVAHGDEAQITLEHIEEANDKLRMGANSKKALSEEDRLKIAYHEAGHAVTGYICTGNDPIHKVSIMSRGSALGTTMFLPDEDRHMHTYDELIDKIIALYGGRAAEEIKYGFREVSTGASNDIERATAIANDMVFKWGMGSKLDAHNINYHKVHKLSETTLSDLNERVTRILSDCYIDAKAILLENEDKLNEMTRLLMKKETINAEDVRRIMDGVR